MTVDDMVMFPENVAIPDTQVFPLTVDRLLHIASNLSDYALSEMTAEPQAQLAETLRSSREAWLVVVADRPVFAVGVIAATVLSTSGAVWLVAVRDLGMAPVRTLKPLLALLLEKYNILFGFVETANPRTARLVQWLGGELYEESVTAGKTYRRFMLEAH